MDKKETKLTKREQQILMIGAWACFFMGLFFFSDVFTLIGMALGWFYLRSTGSRYVFWANVALFVLIGVLHMAFGPYLF